MVRWLQRVCVSDSSCTEAILLGVAASTISCIDRYMYIFVVLQVEATLYDEEFTVDDDSAGELENVVKPL